MKKLTKTQAAKKLGVSRPTLYSMIQRGVITPDENGLIALNGEIHLDVVSESYQSLQSVMQSSGKLKERYKDRYIGQLEQQVGFLQQQVKTLQEELKQKDDRLDQILVWAVLLNAAVHMDLPKELLVPKTGYEAGISMLIKNICIELGLYPKKESADEQT